MTTEDFDAAEKLAMVKRRMAEAAEAFGDDIEGLRAEAERIGDEAGVPVELQHIDIATPEAALEHLLETNLYLLNEITDLKEHVNRLTAMMVELIEATAAGRAKRWCRGLEAAASQAEAEAEAEIGTEA